MPQVLDIYSSSGDMGPTARRTDEQSEIEESISTSCVLLLILGT